MRWHFAICLTVCHGIAAVFGNYTFTREMASQCKRHVSRHGYNYENFYSVDVFDHNTDLKPGVVFEMHLAILAPSNGHILLSSVPKPSTTDPVYELVIGGGGNTFSELRRNLKKNSKAHAKTTGILSGFEHRAFYIKIEEDGQFEFGREGDPLPVLSYYDLDPLPVKYFSFTSWDGVEAEFLYDCPVANSTESSTKSKEVKPKLSPSEQLRQDMLIHRFANTAPEPVMHVKFGLKLTSVKYDAFEAKMYTELAAVAIWTDSSGVWDPDKYNGTTSLKLRQGQIWQPSFLVTNSADIGLLETKNADLISLLYTGQVAFHFRSQVTTWCMDYQADKPSKWPRDEYFCSILLHPWNVHETIQLEIIYPNNTIMKVFSDIDTVSQTEWEVIGKHGIIEAEAWNKVISTANGVLDNDFGKTKSDKYIIHVSLKRRATTYNIVFYTPLLILVMYLLMSFWTAPLTMSRVWFYAGSVIVITMGLSYIEFLVPNHTVPSILMLYLTVLGGALLALLVHIVLMLPTSQRVCKSNCVQYIFTSKLFRTFFCLAALKTCRAYESINAGFLGQEDEESPPVVVAPSTHVQGAPSNQVQEMQRESTPAVDEREECAEVIDKIMFTVYSLTFAVMLGCHF